MSNTIKFIFNKNKNNELYQVPCIVNDINI